MNLLSPCVLIHNFVYKNTLTISGAAKQNLVDWNLWTIASM